VLAVGASTLAAGAFQTLFPGTVLHVLDSPSTTATRHFFAIVGMFMAVIGGAVTQSLFTPGDHRVLLLWGAVQKFGAFVAVSIGVAHDVFSGIAVLVALNDLASSVVLLWYRARI
jgi:hypothetical protein